MTATRAQESRFKDEGNERLKVYTGIDVQNIPQIMHYQIRGGGLDTLIFDGWRPLYQTEERQQEVAEARLFIQLVVFSCLSVL